MTVHMLADVKDRVATAKCGYHAVVPRDASLYHAGFSGWHKEVDCFTCVTGLKLIIPDNDPV